MHAVWSSFYGQWRLRSGAVTVLREKQDSPPERLLQSIWLHQRLCRERLKTVDGREVRVLHPGFHNREGGPDFKGALIQIGDEPAQTGDVEVDLQAAAWKGHGHDRNPAFQRVILHVLWGSPRAVPGGPPTLVIQDLLDAPLGEISLWLGSESGFELPAELRGKCCAPLSQLGETQVTDLLHQAARVRLQGKAAGFQARARQVGWEQSLWEGLFRALGYKHNVWPMQRVAELRSRWAGAAEPLTLQARLFGISGLLPSELSRAHKGADLYVRRIWDSWWRERDQFGDCLMPRTAWRLHGLRPANHPQRRLALGAHWCWADRLPEALEKWCVRELPRPELVPSLAAALQVEPDAFWSWHWTFRSSRLSRPQPLLGVTRVTDLAVNVILPWLLIRAEEGGNEGLARRIETRYFDWPAGEDNAVLRAARQRLFGASVRKGLSGAAAQQGLIQLVRDFCDHSNAVCEACKLPALVQDWKGSFSASGTAGSPPVSQ
jgi:hypothetical protein